MAKTTDILLTGSDSISWIISDPIMDPKWRYTRISDAIL